MEVKVGILHIGREVSVETPESAAALEAAFTSALAAHSVLALVDEHGRRVLIPADRIAYLDLGQERSRRVGFGTV